jgi:hypothetical protein
MLVVHGLSPVRGIGPLSAPHLALEVSASPIAALHKKEHRRTPLTVQAENAASHNFFSGGNSEKR